MATYHCSLKKGKVLTAKKHADYILREGKYAVGKRKEELVYKESGNMPVWAKTPQEFWAAADRYERINAATYYEYEIALPNELSYEENIKLVQEYVRETIGENKAYSFAIHDKPAIFKETERQPHAHIMFSERITDNQIERNKESYFKRYNKKNPERGGSKKDDRFSGRNGIGRKNILKIRKQCEVVINKYLERNKISERVSSASLRKQYYEAVNKVDLEKMELLDRDPEKHLGPIESQKIKEGLKKFENKEEYYDNFASNKALQNYMLRALKENMLEYQRLIREAKELEIKETAWRQAEKDIGIKNEIYEGTVMITGRSMISWLSEHIKRLENQQTILADRERTVKRFILDDKRMLRYAQSIYSKGLSKKINQRAKDIIRIEKTYFAKLNEYYSSPASAPKYDFIKWRDDIDAMKEANDVEIRKLKKEFNTPAAKIAIKKIIIAVSKKNDIRKRRVAIYQKYQKNILAYISGARDLKNKLYNTYTKKLEIKKENFAELSGRKVSYNPMDIIKNIQYAIDKVEETNRIGSMGREGFLRKSCEEEMER